MLIINFFYLSDCQNSNLIFKLFVIVTALLIHCDVTKHLICVDIDSLANCSISLTED